MKPHTPISLLLVLGSLAFNARALDIYTYEVNWPAQQLMGTFTLGFGLEFNRLNTSTQAEGTFGNADGTQTTLTSAQFIAYPNYAELFFWGENGTGRYFDAEPPRDGKLFISWTDADQAWVSLLAQGAAEGISITVIPEPAYSALLYLGLVHLLFLQIRMQKRWLPNKITAHKAGWPSQFRFAVSVFWSGVCKFHR